MVILRSFLRHLIRRRGLTVVQVMGVACGVAAVVGMHLSSRAAVGSFSRGVEFLRGRATHSLQFSAGTVDETVLPRLLRDPAVDALSPVIDRRIRLRRGGWVRLLGIDPLLDFRLRPEIFEAAAPLPGGGLGPALDIILGERTALAGAALASSLGLRAGDAMETGIGRIRLAGTFANPTGEPLLVMDIGQAQELLGLAGGVDRIDLLLGDEASFRSRWASGYNIESRSQHRAALGGMLEAFRVNLEALSLLAFMVGIFLIYNTAMFAVISRRREAGILRSLGSSRAEVAASFAVEISLLGALGGALGGVLGYLLSSVLVGQIGGTVSSLYFFLRPAPPAWSWWYPAAGVVIGVGGALLGATWPLIELVTVDPARTLEGRTAGGEGRAKRAAYAGLLVLALSGLLPFFEGSGIAGGLAAAFGVLAGASLLCGRALILLHPVMRRLLYAAGGLPGRVAAGYIRRNLGRTAVAVAAFMVALSLAVGLGSMIDSFRASVVTWMNNQLRGDLYIGSSAGVTVPEDFTSRVLALPDVGGVDRYRNVRTRFRGATIRLAAVDAGVLQTFSGFDWIQGGKESWDRVRKGSVVVSESFARRFSTWPGLEISLKGFAGSVAYPVAGVFRDYSTEHGLVMMDRGTFLRDFRDAVVDSLGVFLTGDDAARAGAAEKIRLLAAREGLPIFTRKQFFDRILAVFDSTFTVTRAMRAIAILVALFGIAGALLTLSLERSREFGIFRALGFSRAEVSAMTLMEGFGMGAVSFVIAAVAGTALTLVLIKVVNVRNFHWTILYAFTWKPYLTAAATALAAGALAAVYPAWKVWRTYPQMQLREE